MEAIDIEGMGVIGVDACSDGGSEGCSDRDGAAGGEPAGTWDAHMSGDEEGDGGDGVWDTAPAQRVAAQEKVLFPAPMSVCWAAARHVLFTFAELEQ